MQKVTLRVYTEPCKVEGDEIVSDGTKVIGEVRRGDKVLHSKEIITDDTIESVCGTKENVELEIELWAVKNTDFMPTEDALPS
jgi:hypothetical protein